MSAESSPKVFAQNASAALDDLGALAQRHAFSETLIENRASAVEKLEHYDALRAHVKRVRQHALENLGFYLGQFEQEAAHNGAHVHYARDGEELNSLVLSICQQHDAQSVAKGKSMVTEETRLNPFLESAGISVGETDLGEYIIAQAGETPSHIVCPAAHKSADDVRALFLDQHALGSRELPEVEDLVEEARQVMRARFLNADVGVIGANALVAELGYSMLITNEGNGDLCANLPNVLIICSTIERVLPLAEDATAMARLLTRAATGQQQSCYTSFYGGPRRGNDSDGPLETHFVLLDNQRTDLLGSDYQEMLECIRCGACLNHCPVFTAVGGHTYDSVYPGPMGSVLTPLLTSLESSNALPNACTACGRCEEVCPADIPLPDLLRDLRHEEHTLKLSATRWRLGITLHALLSRTPWLYRAVTNTVISLLHAAGKKRGRFTRLFFAGGWSSQRDFPAPAASTFMQQYKRSQKAQRREAREPGVSNTKGVSGE
ncbi:MAG: lactate utilization protein B [Halioglobus sp.]